MFTCFSYLGLNYIYPQKRQWDVIHICVLCVICTHFFHITCDMQDLNCSDYEIECNHKPSMCTVQVESSTLFFYRPIVDRFCVSMFALRLGLTIHIILHMWICYSTYICTVYLYSVGIIFTCTCTDIFCSQNAWNTRRSPFYGVNRGFVAQGFFQLTRNMSGSVHALWHASCTGTLKVWMCFCTLFLHCKCLAIPNRNWFRIMWYLVFSFLMISLQLKKTAKVASNVQLS